MPVLVVLAGVAGFLVDRGAGCLLSIALLRGALHVDSEHESDVSIDAVTYAFPAIAFALLMHLWSGAAFVGPVLFTSLTCLVSGMISIGRGRQIEFEKLGPVAHRRSFWPALGAGFAVWAVVAVPVAYVVGTLTLRVTSGPIRWLAASATPLLDSAGRLLIWLLFQLAQLLPSPVAPPVVTPTPSPAVNVVPPGAPTGGAVGDALMTLLLLAIFFVLPVVIVALCLYVMRQLFGWRQAVARAELPEAPLSVSGQAPSPLARARARLTRPRQPRRRLLNRHPTSAAEAYLALLDDLADVDDLARLPTETPRDHAHRVGEGLQSLPLALLAADYQLATYAHVPLTDRETARALGRWQLLRALVERRPPRE